MVCVVISQHPSNPSKLNVPPPHASGTLLPGSTPGPLMLWRDDARRDAAQWHLVANLMARDLRELQRRQHLN